MDYSKCDWQGISQYRDRVFVIDVNGPNGYKEISITKADLNNVNVYVEYHNKSIYAYQILERVIDDKKNLVLFCELTIQND